MVQKPDGSWRPCGDYRQLNLQTVEDKYPLSNMADLAARLDSCRLFSKLDLRKGYLQVPVAEEDIAKTAIITPFGLFEFTRMPFGLRNVGMTFQRLMDSLLGNLPFAFVYLDDILVASPDPSSHRRHLETVFAILQNNASGQRRQVPVQPFRSGFFRTPPHLQGDQPPPLKGAGHRRFSPAAYRQAPASLSGALQLLQAVYSVGGEDSPTPHQGAAWRPQRIHAIGMVSGDEGRLLGGQASPLLFGGSGPPSPWRRAVFSDRRLRHPRRRRHPTEAPRVGLAASGILLCTTGQGPSRLQRLRPQAPGCSGCHPPFPLHA